MGFDIIIYNLLVLCNLVWSNDKNYALCDFTMAITKRYEQNLLNVF